jgi:preprotein translocase subunit SecG
MLFYYGLVTVYVLICFLLLVVVLLQQGKGGGIAAAFGGSSSQTAFGARTGATVLTRATTVLGSLFLVGAFVLTLIGRTGVGGSVVSGVEGPAPAADSAPPPVAAPPAESPAQDPAPQTP